jgi:hypothetical protein
MIPRRQAYKREITLMSHGFSNPTAWPGGKITVYPWDSDIDSWVGDPKRDAKQNLIYGLLEKVVELNGAKADDVVFGEVNALLLLSRAIQYSGNMAYESQCPYCQHKREETIVIPDDLEPLGAKDASYPGYDEIKLPICGDIVRIRPLRVGDHRKIEERDAEAKEALPDRIMFILLPVVSIGGGEPETREELLLWYRALHPEDAHFIETEEERLTPHLNNAIPHTCDACTRAFTQILMFDQKFFRSGSGRRPGSPLA